MTVCRDHVVFVVAWQLSGSLDVAARVLNSTVEEVERIATWMRDAGVPLKVFDDGNLGRGNADRVSPPHNDGQVPPLAGSKSDETEAPTTAGRGASSYIAQLKTDAQMRFYARYAYGKDGGPSIATSVGEYIAGKSGDIGRAGIASGVVEDTAFEAVAQLAVAPPKGFNPKHRRAEGFVVRHIQNAVRNRLNTEYGWKGRRLGGRISADTCREAGPVSPAEADDEITKAKALEVVRVRQLEQVKGVLPGGVIPTDRAGRVALLRELGQCKTEAETNAAERRFYTVLGGIIPALLEATPRERPAVYPATPKSPRLSAHVVPQNIRQRFIPTPPVKSRQQREAERFVVAWQRSSCALEAAQKLGKSVRSVTAYSEYLREVGVGGLKTMPARPGELVRGVRALVPSRN